MVYKKYIKKDGKLYGPYIYESKRVDGKVVSEYHGSKRNVSFKKFAWIFTSAVFVLFIVYCLSSFDFSGFTGQAVLNTDFDYTADQPITGNVNLLLKQGELIPSSSKLVLENSNQSYEYSLNELVSNRLVQGEFYISGISLSGRGEGYGISGEKQVYPDIDFVLQIYPSVSENFNASNEIKDSQSEDFNSETESDLNESTGVAENNSISENAETQDEENNNTQTQNENTEVSVPTEVESDSVASEQASSVSVSADLDSSTENTDTAEQVPDISSEDSSASESTSTEESAPADTPPSESVTEASTITGFFIRIYNFFLTLTPTGNVVLQSGAVPDISAKEISGQTSFGDPFVYNLLGGEGVQLKPGSVSVSDSVIPDDNVKVNMNADQIIVETSYTAIEKGFGEEYKGDDTEILNINLSALGLVLNEGELTIKIVYEDNEIISLKTFVAPGAVKSVSETFITNSTILNVTIEKQNESLVNSTQIIQDLQVITSETASLVLTEDEKLLLAQEFGADANVETTKSEIFNGRLVKRYELGNQWIEYSYDADLPEDKLEYQVSLDRMKWLKDLAYRIKASKVRVQQNTASVENFSID